MLEARDVPTVALQFDYSLDANNFFNTQAKKDSIWSSIKHLGRMKNFMQDIRATYRLPLDKIPLLDWIAADAVYGVGYQFQQALYSGTRYRSGPHYSIPAANEAGIPLTDFAGGARLLLSASR